MPSEDELLHAKTQQQLIDFLRIELQLGPTFATSALLAQEAGHMNHYHQARQNAIKATEAVRRSMGRVEDIAVRTEIAEQLAEFEMLVSKL